MPIQFCTESRKATARRGTHQPVSPCTW